MLSRAPHTAPRLQLPRGLLGERPGLCFPAERSTSSRTVGRGLPGPEPRSLCAGLHPLWPWVFGA